MTTSVIPQKGLPKDYLVNIKGDFPKSITEVVGETPSDPTTLILSKWKGKPGSLKAWRRFSSGRLLNLSSSARHWSMCPGMMTSFQRLKEG